MFVREFKPTAKATRRRFFATEAGGRTPIDERVRPIKLITSTESETPTPADLVVIVDGEGSETKCLLGDLTDIEEALTECLADPGRRLHPAGL